MPGKHALLSASGASRWMECPPSARLEADLPESISVYADEGTLAHSIGELIIRKYLGWITRAEFDEGYTRNGQYHKGLNDYQKDPLYSSEMLDHCEGYATFVIEKYNQEEGSKIYPEQKLDMSRWIEDGFGTADAPIIRVKSKHLLCIDLKYGKGVPVSAMGNKQGMLYLLGALEVFDFIYDLEQATFIIYQPRLDSITEFSISVADLKEWAETVLKPAAALAYAGQGEFNPGDHCRFCKIKPTCRALADFNLAIAKNAFEGENLKPGPLLRDDEVSEVMIKGDLFRNWIGAVEEHAQIQAVKYGKKWPGFKLVEGRSNRRFVDEVQVAKRLEEKGYGEEIIFNKKLRTITDLTKEMGKLDFEDILKDLIIKPAGAPTLVPESDKRPEINSAEKVKAMFDEEV